MSVMPPPMTSSRWGSRTKRIVALVAIVVIGFAVMNISGVLPLLIVASVLSFLLWPLANLIERHVLGIFPFQMRTLAVLLSFVVVIALFTLAIIVIVPALIAQISEVSSNLVPVVDSVVDSARNLLNRPISIGGSPVLIDGDPVIPLERLQELTGVEPGADILNSDSFDLTEIAGTFMGSLGGLTGPAFGVLGEAVNVVINIFFLFIIMFYFMRDGDRFIDRAVSLAPPSYQGDMRRFFFELGQVWNAYLRGQLILSVTVGLAVYIAALVLGLPNAPILGLLAGLLEFIPNLGPIVAAAPAVTIALLSESSTFPFLFGLPFALVVAATYVVIQQVESYYMVPRVMGGSLNLHPVVVIIALLIGASVAGALGVILAAPLTATLRLVWTYIYGKLFDVDPFPSQYTTSQPRSNFIIRLLHPDRLREYRARLRDIVVRWWPLRWQRLKGSAQPITAEHAPSAHKTEEEIVHHEG